jgi:hypothetical protein
VLKHENYSKSFKERTILGRLTLNLKPGAGKEDLEKALKGHVIRFGGLLE